MWDKAALIIRLFALEHGLEAHKLLHGGRTRNLGALRRQLRRRLRDETTLSWAEINDLTGYSKHSHRA